MDAQTLYPELAAAHRADLARLACRSRPTSGSTMAAHGVIRQRVSRLLIDVGRRLGDAA